MISEAGSGEMVAIGEEAGLYDIGPQVCVTHQRFLPCRKADGCVPSGDQADIAQVAAYQDQKPVPAS
jgi:hypothetical protein